MGSIYHVNLTRLIANHLLALLALATGVSSTAVLIGLVSYYARAFAIGAGHHRYFSHRSFGASRGFQFTLALVGVMASQRGPLSWASSHRRHHAFADQPGDPHSPQTGSFWHAHLGWVLAKDSLPTDAKLLAEFKEFPEILFLNQHSYVGPLSLMALMGGLGYWLEVSHPELGVTPTQLIVWGFVIPTLVLLHATCFINSLLHRVGRKRFDLRADQSRNQVALFPFLFGENWHNNHHRYPALASAQVAWWEVDLIYWMLRFFSLFGWTHSVKRPPTHATSPALAEAS